MRKVYSPRTFAATVVKHFGEQPRCALWGKPGVGKSILTLTHLEILHNVLGEDRPTLVVAPLRVARDGWARESEKWEHLRGFDIVPITGTVEERKAALRKQAPVYTTNYEQLPWLVDTLGKKWPFATVVADEATKLKGFRLRQGTQRAQALAKVSHTQVERFIQLTGTPASNGLEDLWGQVYYLDAGQRLGRTFSAFRDRWFRPVKAGDFHNYRATDYAQAEIQERLADICLTLDPKDWFDLKDPIVNVIEVELPKSARVKYREMERELFTMIADKEVEAMSAAAKSQKCLQMANGAVYLDPERYGAGTWVECHTEKLDALHELVEETGDDPLLVVYYFKSDLARLQREFPDGLNLSEPEGMAQAMAGKGKLWFGHPASMGHGVDGLQYHCNTIVFFAQDWNLEYRDQVIERVGPMRQMQAGLDRPVFIHHIIARGTLDEVVMARMDGKRSVQNELLEYMKNAR